METGRIWITTYVTEEQKDTETYPKWPGGKEWKMEGNEGILWVVVM